MLNYQDKKALRRGVGLTAILTASVILAGCYAGPPRVRTAAVVEEPSGAIVTLAPPEPRVEAVPVAPGPRYVWTTGHWAWNGAAYVWVAGQYVERPRSEAMWVAGHWASRNGGWVWIDGHWA